MPNSILHKRSSTAGVVPHAALLANGELALNTADGTWFLKKTDGTVLDLRQPLLADGGEQPLSGINPDAQDWITRVYAAGGTVSSTTANAVNNFCNTIDNAGLRDRFYRLNLFCGNNLTACLVPLYRGQSLGGTQFGNTTDTNFDFVASDYVERGPTGGLTGNGNLGIQAGSATKHLRTGLQQATLETSLLHLAAYAFGLNTTAPIQQSFIGVRNNSSPAARWWLSYRQPFIIGELGDTNVATMGTPIGAALVVVSRSSNALLRHYVNGLQSGPDYTTDITASLVNRPNEWYVAATNLNGTTPVEPCGFRLGMYSIGLALTPPQAQVFNTIVQTFQTALNRLV